MSKFIAWTMGNKAHRASWVSRPCGVLPPQAHLGEFGLRMIRENMDRAEGESK